MKAEILNELSPVQALIVAGCMVGLAYFVLGFTTDVISGQVLPEPSRARGRRPVRRRRRRARRSN